MELLVYKASAGSGKTFTLAVEYIKHLIRDPRAYRQILAVTFTNKATTEMKERILQQLYGIWKGVPSSEPYLKKIMEAPLNPPKGGTPDDANDNSYKSYKTYNESPPLGGIEGGFEEFIRQRAGEALLLLMHDYSFFRVETIDSFFQSVMRNLARELGLAPNLNIELDNSAVLSDAVDGMIEKLTPDSPVLAWLLDYIDERIRDDKRWNVSGSIKKFAQNIFDEGYIERGKQLRESLKDGNLLKDYKKQLRDMETEALEQMKGFYDQFEGELEAHGLAPEDLKGGKNGIGSYFRKLRDGRLSDKDVLNVTLQKCLDNANEWAAKSSPQRGTIVRLAEESLLPLLQEAERMRPQRNRTLNSCHLSLRHLGNLQLLNHIDEEVRTQNRERNRFLLSDTNALLHSLVHEGDSSFVFEKVGANIRNVMIDEFQDTSRMQWDNFRLLLLEGLSQGADSLIVGDVKQSIYRWRNGDWQILNNLAPLIPPKGGAGPTNLPRGEAIISSPLGGVEGAIRVETLKVNRRSEERIVRFNNSLFQSAVDYLNTLYLGQTREECYPLKRAYADVEQEFPSEKERGHGYIRVSFVKPDEEHNYTEQTLKEMGEAVRRLLDEGVKLNDIAILVRKNKNIPPIADYFDHELHLPIVSDEAFRLDASAAVCMLMDALRCLDCPADKIAEASLILSQPDHRLPPAFTAGKESLRMLPLYELLETLYALFHVNRIEKQEAYLFAFFDAVTEYLQDHSSSLTDFIRHWDESLCFKTIPGGEIEGIRIYSIHKSKGLEFHTVLIPFCDWKLENETYDQLVWCHPPEAPYDRLSLVPVTYSALMGESVYGADYRHEQLQLWVDNLNLLYVAFTRAGKNLLVWSKQEKSGTMSEILAQTLPSVSQKGEGSWDEEAATYEYGTICPARAEKRPEEANRLAKRPEKLPVRMESAMPQVEFRQSNRSADFVGGGVGEEETAQSLIDRGRLLHTLFSAIKTEADIDEAISRLLFEGVIDSVETEQEIRQLTRRAFAQPEVRDWYSGRWRLFNECDIIWQENGALCTRRPDRVMMREGEIIVVDFKFGKPRKEHHRQVRLYASLLVRMGYPQDQIRGYLWYVDESRVEAVI